MTDCPSIQSNSLRAPVKLALAALLFTFASAAAAEHNAPVHDSIRLNIGLNCRWERRCIAQQQRAMNSALAFVKANRPAQARIHLCNRNASRGRGRVDWVGFNNCIRNASLRTARRR